MNLDEFIKGRKKIYIFGASKNGEILLEVLKEKRRLPSGYMDNSESRWNDRRGYRRVMKPQLKKGKVIISCIAYGDVVRKQLIDLGYDERDLYVITPKELALSNSCEEDDHYIYKRAVKAGVREEFVLKIRNVFYRGWLKAHPVKTGTHKRYNVSICAIFKNEAPYLKEWLDYHVMIGVEHFYMYNNGSTDGYMEILRSYTESGTVTLQDWNAPHPQMDVYWDCINRYRGETQWMGFIDLDEFVLPLACDSISEYLNTKMEYGSVVIHWRMFGSSGLEERDMTGRVTKDFTSCYPKPSDVGKCFWNTDYDVCTDKTNWILYHLFWTVCAGKKIPPVDCCGNFCEYTRKIVRCGEQDIQLNHYVTKSHAEYQRKMSKTDAIFEVNPRSEEEYNKINSLCRGTDTNILRSASRT